MKIKQNKKFIYVIILSVILFILLVIITLKINSSDDNNINNTTSNTINLSKNDFENQEEEKEDVIIFNDSKLANPSDVDAKYEQANLNEEFDFIDGIDIPKFLQLFRQCKVFVRNDTTNSDYSTLKQYNLFYMEANNSSSPLLEINFTKDQSILGYKLLDEEEIQPSIINGKEVLLFKTDYSLDEYQISKSAFFKSNGYNFFITSYKLFKDEFLDVIKSLIK